MLEQYFYCCKEQTNIQFCYLFCPCCSGSSASECDADRVRQRWDEMNIVATSAPADAYLKKLTNSRGSMASSFFSWIFFISRSFHLKCMVYAGYAVDVDAEYRLHTIKHQTVPYQHISLYFAGDCVVVWAKRTRGRVTVTVGGPVAYCGMLAAFCVVARWVCG